MRPLVVRSIAGGALAGASILLVLALRPRHAPALDPAPVTVVADRVPDAAIVADASVEDGADDAADASDAGPPPAEYVRVDTAPPCLEFYGPEHARIERLADEAVDGGHALVRDDGVYCHATPGGGWAARIDEPGFALHGDDLDADGTWELLHLSRDGSRVAFANGDSGADFTYTTSSVSSHHDHRLEVLSDYDGDGEPELLVWNASVYSEGDIFDSYAIYTYKNGSVTPYAPASSIPIADMEDIDGDGRKDILTSVATVADYQNCLGGHVFSAFGWPAHATASGTFDTHDPAARAYVAKACATARTKLLVNGQIGMDLDAIAKAVVCQRAAGRSPDAIRTELAAGCDTYGSTLGGCRPEDFVPRECPDWFQTLPDVALP